MSLPALKDQPSSKVVYLNERARDKEPEAPISQKIQLENSLKVAYNEIRSGIHQISSAKEGGIMDWQEKYIDKLDKAIEKIDLRIDGVKEDITNLKKEIRTEFNQVIGQFLGEIRDRDNQRHNELLMINQRIDKNIGDLTSEIRATNKWIIGLVIAAIGLVGAAIGLAITAIAAIGR